MNISNHKLLLTYNPNNVLPVGDKQNTDVNGRDALFCNKLYSTTLRGGAARTSGLQGRRRSKGLRFVFCVALSSGAVRCPGASGGVGGME